ncbi:hypothetical protein B5G09_10240 [Alistipes sp. An54]|uniref:hypothetical protein n=1 Tax=Alistipes sp. An54 TaxID=1965645 RepID=UPI000B3AD619|nr:hypothetical protein [Alistipes sp. An54]OUN76454.1 hypothetical protein B5G09_10240 [Alistipes sp. An54]
MERWPVIKDILLVFLPVISSVVTWFVSRRKQNNDFLRELQSSINLLSGENKKILEENIQLRRENIDLKVNQEEMLMRIDRLTKEVERLRKAIGKRTSYEDNTLFSATRRAADELRTDEELGLDRNGHPGRHRPARASPRTGHHEADDAGGDDLAVGGDLGTTGSALGGDTPTDNLGDGNGGEPP